MRTQPALFADETGAKGPVIVLLHGFGGSHETWHGLIEALPAPARVLAYDLPGHARSIRAEGATSSKSMASAVLADLERRQAGTVHVAGHSMGGAIGALMALMEPARIASLSLLAPGGFGPQINAPLLGRFAAAKSAADVAKSLSKMMAAPNAPDARAVAILAAHRKRPGQQAVLAGIVEQITRGGQQGTIPLPKLAGPGIPTTVGWGRLDRVLPVTQALRLPSGFEVRLFENAGHMLPDECPVAAAGLIADTIARSRRGAP